MAVYSIARRQPGLPYRQPAGPDALRDRWPMTRAVTTVTRDADMRALVVLSDQQDFLGETEQ